MVIHLPLIMNFEPLFYTKVFVFNSEAHPPISVIRLVITDLCDPTIFVPVVTCAVEENLNTLWVAWRGELADLKSYWSDYQVNLTNGD